MTGGAARRWGVAAALAMVAVAAIGLRAWRIAATPLWLDEAYSAYAAGHGFAFLWQIVPRYETHPPFYYSLLRLWTLAFGDGLIALRLPGLLAGLATIALLAAAGRRAGMLLGWTGGRRRGLPLLLLALASVATPLVEMSREVRPYPLMILTYAAALAVLLRLAERRRAGEPLGGRAFVAHLLLTEAMLWLHNVGPLFAAAMGLALLAAVIHRDMSRRDWGWLVGGHGLVLLGWLPALAILRDQAPTWIGSTWLRFAWATVPPRLAVLYAVPGWPGLAALVLCVLAVAALARRGGEGRRLLAMLLALALVPVALSLAASAAIAPIFIMRTMTPVAVPTLLLLGIGALAHGGRARIAGVGAAAVLGLNMLAVDLQARAGPVPQDWYGTVAWLRARVRPGDLILAYPNEGALPLAYALRDRGLAYPIRPIPAAVPAFDQGGWFPTGSRGVVSLPPDRLHAIAVAPETQAAPTIWLLRLGAETYDRGDVFLRELHRGRRIIRTWRAGPIDIVGLRRADQRKTRK